MKQTDFWVEEDRRFKKPYGGDLLKKRKARLYGRPLDTKSTMHLVLRSSKAIGPWSFKLPSHERKIEEIITKFSFVYGIKVLSMANVGNHLHFQIKISNRFTYAPFIRAITGAIAMAITGVNRWKKSSNKITDPEKTSNEKTSKLRFWDYRPFTRVVKSFKAYLNLRDYIQINRIEGFGYRKNEGRFIWAMAGLKSKLDSG